MLCEFKVNQHSTIWINPALVRTVSPGDAGYCSIAFDGGHTVLLPEPAAQVAAKINDQLLMFARLSNGSE